MAHRCSLLFVSAFCLAAACGGDDGGGPGPTPTQLSRVAGDSQVAAAGMQLPAPLQVVVRDAGGMPLPGIAVNWAPATGGGSVNPTSSTTNTSGIAATVRTLGTGAGAQTTTAARTGLTTVTFTSIAQIQGATQLQGVSGAPQSDSVLATLPNPLVVRARDHLDAPVAGVTVTWTAPGTGKVNGLATTTTTTNASGEASVTYQLGSAAGAQAPTAAVAGLAGSPVTFALIATAASLNAIVKTAGDGGSAAPNGQVIYTVTARDAHSNPKAGVTIDWEATGGGGSISPAQNTTGTNGTASATRTLSAGAGAHTATARAAAIPQTVTFTTTVTSAPPTAAVNVGDNTFTPDAVTISVGGTVTWTWVGANSHNVTFSAGGPSPIGDMTSGSGARVFPGAGMFNYSCTNHGGMTGSVTVQ